MRDALRLSRSLAFAALACAAAAPFAPAAAAQPSAGRGRSDAHSYAAAMNVSLPEAQRRLALQLRLGDLEIRLRQAADRSFAGLWIEHRSKFSVQVRFTDVAAGERLVRALAGELAAEFAVGAADASLAELEALQEASLRQMRAAGVAVDADIDIAANRVELRTTEPETATRLLAELPSAVPARLAIVAVDALAQPQQGGFHPLRGGRPLWGCSSGFTARNAGGSVGVLTAGHCADVQEYPDWDLPLTYVSGQVSGSRDVQFHNRHCNMRAPNEFDSGVGIRLVTATRSRDQQVVGSQVCRYGAATPYRCGLITSKSFCPSSVSSCSSTFIRVHPTDGQPLSANGDSGGPWFADTYAYGIHSGGVGGSIDSFYMAVNYATTVASVLTVDAGGGHLTGHMTCSGNHLGSPQVSCAAGMTGGVPPFTTSVWGYWGDADSWSTYFNTGRAHYSFGGCFPNAGNYFSVQITDSCGTVGNATGYAPCPDSCLQGPGEDSLQLPPICSLSRQN